MDSQAIAFIVAGLGAVGVTFGAAFGISKVASTAMQGMARQPEAAGEIRGAMVISAAMIEGVALLAAVTCFLLSLK